MTWAALVESNNHLERVNARYADQTLSPLVQTGWPVRLLPLKTVLVKHCFPPGGTGQFARISLSPTGPNSNPILGGVSKILPGRSFCPGNCPGSGMLGLTKPPCCLRSPASKPGLIRLLFQLDSIPYCRFPLYISNTTGTTDLMATARGGHNNNRGREDGPLSPCL